MRPASRILQFDESIIREMTRHAMEQDAINLSQGYPDFDPPPEIVEAAVAAIRGDENQYTVTWGYPPLRDKLAAGLRKALTRRPVPDGAADQAADEIEAELRASGTSEIPSSRIGHLAQEKLRAIDQIAYIRFASVYQSFEDLADLKREVDRVIAERDDEGPTDPPRRRAARG